MAFVFERFKHVGGAHVGSIPLDEKYGYIYPKEGGHRVTVTSWLFASCACAGLEHMDSTHSWEDVDGFLAFLRDWKSPYGWYPKKFYFLVKVSNEYEGKFLTELKKRARLVDEFDNHAHHSTGKLGVYTLEVWE
jgi:hypothetical protein